MVDSSSDEEGNDVDVFHDSSAGDDALLASANPADFLGAGTVTRGRRFAVEVLRHTWRIVRRSKLNCCLGCMACLLVVAVVALLTSVVANAPLVFLRLAELQVGEVDLGISAGPWTGHSLLNYTEVAQVLAGQEDQQGRSMDYHSMRWQGQVEMSSSLCSGIGVVSAGGDPSLNGPWRYTDCDLNENSARQLDAGNCFGYAQCQMMTMELYAIDSEREKRMGLGRAWTLPPLKANEIYVDESLRQFPAMNIAVGARVIVRLDGRQYFSQLWESMFNVDNKPGLDVPFSKDPSDVDSARMAANQMQNGTAAPTPPAPRYSFSQGVIYWPVTVKGFVPAGALGKLGTEVQGRIGFAELGPLASSLARVMHPDTPPLGRAAFGSVDLRDYAQTVQINLPPPRVKPYMSSNYDLVQQATTGFSSDVSFRLGFSRLWTSQPILGELRGNRFSGLFLGLILNIITFILLYLSILLVYSLLMINVESRAFEMGVFRMVGMSRSGVVAFLLAQAFAYAVPAWALGLTVAQVGGWQVARYFETLANVSLSGRLTPESIVWASALGIAVPLAAAVFPIRTALGKTLSTALDTQRSATTAVKITVNRSEAGGRVSWALLVGGGLGALFGFGVYFLVPLALLSFDLALLVNVFMAVLVGLLLGLVLLALNVQWFLEAAIVWLFFSWWQKTAVRHMVLKNLVAHKLRNRKTTIMFALSLSFIIFISVAYKVQADTFSFRILQRNGAYVHLNTGDSSENLPLNKAQAEIQRVVASLPGQMVEGTAAVSFNLEDVSGRFTDLELETIGSSYVEDQRLIAAEPGFFATALDFTRPSITPQRAMSPDQLGDLVYSAAGSGGALLGTLFHKEAGLGLGAPFALQTTIGRDEGLSNAQAAADAAQEAAQSNSQSSEAAQRAAERAEDDGSTVERVGPDRTELRAVAFLDGAPIFRMSPFPASGTQSAMVSFTTWLDVANRLLPDRFQSVDDVPITQIILKLKDGLNDTQIDFVVRKLRDIKGNFGVFDYRTRVSSVEYANELTGFFFNGATIIAMLISYFSLMSSMSANILEQTKEIGVVRAVGFSKSIVYSIYLIEAFCVVFGASILGIAIGFMVGYTTLSQQALFTQLPLTITVDWSLLITVLVTSILTAVLSTFGPIRAVLKKSPVQILRFQQ